MVVAGAGGEAAAHSGARLLAEFASLTMQNKHSPGQMFKYFKPFSTSPFQSFLEAILFIDNNLLNHREGIGAIKSSPQTFLLPQSMGPYNY